MTAEPSQETINQCVLQSHGNFPTVRQMIEEEPRLLNASAEWQETPLQAASHTGRRQIAEYLLDKGAPLDVFAAAMLGRKDDVVRFLNENPELIHTRGVHDMPILFFPAVSGQLEVARLLVARGADVNEGAGDNTPLHGAAHFNKIEMARWLLAQGADPSALDYEGKTPLQVATDGGSTDVSELLQQRTATA